MTTTAFEYRTHTWGELRAADAGKEVTLLGWVHRVRNLGGLIFFDLRDRYGLTQVVVRTGSVVEETATRLRAEFVVSVRRSAKKPACGTATSTCGGRRCSTISCCATG